MKKSLQILVLGAIALLFSACASSSAQKNSLIENPSLLKQSKHNKSAYVYIKEGTNFKKYNRIEIPTIKVKNDKENKMDSTLASQISTYFTNSLSLKLNHILRNNPGMQTLTLDVAVDSVNVGYQDLKVWQFIPVSLAITAVSRGTGMAGKDLNIAIALRLKDRDNKETLAMAIDSKMKEDVKSIEDVKFHDVRPLLDNWVKTISKRFEELNK